VVEAHGINHGSAQDVGPDRVALLYGDDRDLGAGISSALLEADRGRKPGWACAHDHHVKVHRLAGN